MFSLNNPFFQYQSTRTNFDPYIQAVGEAGQLQSNAAQQAGQLGLAGIQEAGNLLGAGNVASQQVRDPFIGASQGALGGIQGLLGMTPGVDPTEQLRATPGYQFQLQEGADAINRGAASQGKLNSGQTLQALQKYGQGLADSTYQQQVGNLMSLLNQTSPFAAQQAGQEFALGTQRGQLAVQGGQVQADAALAAARAQADALEKAGQAQVAQSTIGGQLLQTPGQSVQYGGSSSPWGNTAGGNAPINRDLDNTGGFTPTGGDSGSSPSGDSGVGGGSLGMGSNLGGASSATYEPIGGSGGSSITSGSATIPGTNTTVSGGVTDSGFSVGFDSLYGDQRAREDAQRQQRQQQFTQQLGSGASRLTNPERLNEFSDDELGSVSTVNLGGQDFLYIPNRRLGELFGGNWGYIPL